jgi:hypothetical protein
MFLQTTVRPRQVAMANELPIPPQALANRSVEIIRVWLANNQQHIALNIGFWEDRGINEREVWELMIADMIHHIANAHKAQYGYVPEETVAIVRRAFETEMSYPTSERLGEFVAEKRPGIE